MLTKNYFWLVVMATIVPRFIMVVIIILIVILGAHAHDDANWISRGGKRNAAGEWCCGKGDCVEVPGDNVFITTGGYRFILKLIDGQGYTSEIVPYNETQPSPDGKFWRCRRADGSRRCVFVPPPPS